MTLSRNFDLSSFCEISVHFNKELEFKMIVKRERSRVKNRTPAKLCSSFMGSEIPVSCASHLGYADNKDHENNIIVQQLNFNLERFLCIYCFNSWLIFYLYWSPYIKIQNKFSLWLEQMDFFSKDGFSSLIWLV